MNYREATAYLDSLQLHKIKLGLEAMESFLDKVSRPDKRLRFVHVAGTNGKGSVSVNIVTILEKAGYRTGLFTSPHLSSVRERFRINSTFITEEKFAELATTVKDVLGQEKITYFEFTTAVALLWFAENDVDLVVLETGLGGRLDATNVVTPLVSVITNISMDHEAYLGTTLKSIAYEKAGIIKPHVPVVSGMLEKESLSEIDKKCFKQQAPLLLYDRDFQVGEKKDGTWSWSSEAKRIAGNYDNLRCGMKGDYQKANSSLAICCLQLLREHGFSFSAEMVREGLLDMRWPGRLEYLEREKPAMVHSSGNSLEGKRVLRYLIDGAHNPAGVESLLKTLIHDYAYTRLVVIWGAMEDKDLSLTVPPISRLAANLILTKPEGERAAKPEMLLDVIPKELHDRCLCITDVGEALMKAESIAGPDDLIVVAGSLYLIGDVRQRLVGELVDD